jgi:hypothetical protein
MQKLQKVIKNFRKNRKYLRKKRGSIKEIIKYEIKRRKIAKVIIQIKIEIKN